MLHLSVVCRLEAACCICLISSCTDAKWIADRY